MKLLLLSILTLVVVNTAFADDSDLEMSCLTVKSEKVIGVTNEIVFNIDNCDQKSIGQDVKAYMLGRSGYEFEWYQDGASSIKKAISFLRTDFSDSDGSYPAKEDDISKIVTYYLSDAASEDVMMAEYADSYMSGTGVYQMVYLYNADKTQLIMIEKFVYAE